ncbi:4560_t:CDS:2 [Racocetra fulgida]|uniref:4560_t:CDS:1 n=1 Tax=Racocetra fulgida TaxID=60492 RepID=A0A9N9BXV6_9GLOM|nr:4560_t:CDS:2 [Racocetra fulgida]
MEKASYKQVQNEGKSIAQTKYQGLAKQAQELVIRIWGKINIMTELIIIRTHESEKIRKFLEQERVDYEVYHEEEKPQKISEAALGRAYQEAWSNPQRYQEAQK